jgi:hypothetical protein
MLVTLNALEWQVLRAVLRYKGKDGCPGHTLRITPNRRTKDGKFLTELADAGLMEAVGAPEPVAKSSGGVPDETPEPFRTRWRLTENGKHAAEYGEYDDGVTGPTLPTPEEFAAAKRAEAGGGREPEAKAGKKKNG